MDLFGRNKAGKKTLMFILTGRTKRTEEKIGIAMVLMGRPGLLVLDEPVNGLDQEGILQLRELLKKLNKEHRTTILI
ncbi:MAG: hypothetical protein K2K35_12580 [Lachnospiraceae bacterium]|nr:hypothetical protein [Lachnospiraceae bacterium]